MRPRVLLVLALVLLAPPAPAVAQLLDPAPPEQTAPAQPVGAQDEDGLERWQQALIVGAGLVLIGGIAWAILSDARRSAPVVRRAAGQDLDAGRGRLPARERERRRRQARARTRAQRQARKRNR